MTESLQIESNIRNYSIPSYFSFGMGDWALEMANGAFAGLYFFFYETELLLMGGFIIAAQVIFALYNAINDPIIGFITEKPHRFTKKYGIRFPWLATTIIPLYFFYFLLFSPPDGMGQWAIFAWMVITLCLCDTIYSIFYVHFKGCFAEKYITSKDRNIGASLSTVLAMIGMVTGMLVPPLIYKWNDPKSFSLMALVIGGIGVICAILVIPGVKPTKLMLEREILTINSKRERTPFFTQFKLAFSMRNLRGYLLLYLSMMIFDQFLMGTLPYYIKWILGITADDAFGIYIFMIVGMLVAIPIISLIAKKTTFRQAMIIAGCVKIVSLMPYLFIDSLNLAIVFSFFGGFGSGAAWAMMMPNLSQALDEIAVKTKSYEKGSYVGFVTLVGRLGIIIFTTITLFIHYVTNFIEDAPMGQNMQPFSAIIGIRISISMIPSIVFMIGLILFSKMNNMTREKAREIQEQLRQMQ